jgi:hypothetical protein
MNRHFLLAITLLVAVTGCKKSSISTSVAQQPRSGDVCGLITNAEVQAIEGSPVKETKPSQQSDGKFRYSQCFYTTEVFNMSVSVALTERDPASDSARDPREFWKETFGRYEETKKETSEEDKAKKQSLNEQEQEERGRQPPKKIDGIGDSAWWTAGRMGGTIYVLKNNAFLRVSVGGPGKEEEQLERAKKLTIKAVSRL